MTVLADNQPRSYEVGVEPIFNNLPAVAADIIYEGAACSEDAGFVVPLDVAEKFVGFAEEKCDNSAGSSGDKNVLIRSHGIVELVVVGVATVADYGVDVYALEDNLFTLTSTSAKNIGKVHRHISGTTCMVQFTAEGLVPRIDLVV